MKLGKLVTVTALTTGIILGAFIDSADAIRRPPSPGGGGSNLPLPSELGGNPDIKFDFFLDDELGNLILDNDGNTSNSTGEFLGVIQNFSYLIPETGDAYFNDVTNTYFFNDSGDLLSKFLADENIVSYEIRVTSGVSGEFNLSYPFFFTETEVTDAGLTIEEAVNDITKFATLINNQIGTGDSIFLEGSLSCINSADQSNDMCKKFSDNFVIFANKYIINPNDNPNDIPQPIFGNEPDLSSGLDPGNLELGRFEEIELPPTEVVPEPTTILSLLGLGIFSLTTIRKHRKNT